MSSDGNSTPQSGPDGRPLGPDGKPLPGPQQMQQVMAQRRMAQQQAQVDEVCGIMKNNVEKVLERDTKLTELDERADALQDGASQFEKQAGKLKNKFWLQNMKFIVIGAILGLILLIMLYFKFSDEPQQPIYYQSPPSQSDNIASGSNIPSQ
ncbi:vesicle-associated membrane protein 2-like [Tigriopus californicus]|uniref:vesicle-associated membrane protein 2-like n=1 Tax=Tigriopus californicus TaxID=6832 RepID=UPI0027D9E703|nr:vesicle-associated membrane protein 2-like [Tigriopus californicus]